MGTAFAPESIENLTPEEALSAVLEAHAEQLACLTCSFQAEDMVALSSASEDGFRRFPCCSSIPDITSRRHMNIATGW